MLRLFPSAAGMQHDETRSGVFRFAAATSADETRRRAANPSVIERFALDEVLQYDVMAPYRPEAMREHQKTKQFYRPTEDSKEKNV